MRSFFSRVKQLKNYANLHEKIMEIVSELQTTHKRSGLVSIPEDAVTIDSSYLGEGYGLPSKKTLDAIRLAASLEVAQVAPAARGPSNGTGWTLWERTRALNI